MTTVYAFDLETTGRDATTCLIRQCALVPFDLETRKMIPARGFKETVRCPAGVVDEPGAFAVHKIPSYYGISEGEFRASLLGYLERERNINGGERLALLGHNAGQFDYPILLRIVPEATKYLSYRIRDTAPLILAGKDMGRLPGTAHSMGEVWTALFPGRAPAEFHDALGDACSEAEMYFRLLDVLGEARAA